eukprot:6184281-Pleurochrysis_carterae.AAC.1
MPSSALLSNKADAGGKEPGMIAIIVSEKASTARRGSTLALVPRLRSEESRLPSACTLARAWQL